MVADVDCTRQIGENQGKGFRGFEQESCRAGSLSVNVVIIQYLGQVGFRLRGA